MTINTDSRTVINPIIRDKATFIEKSVETGDRYSLIQFELGPGGGNQLHYHRHLDETFTVIEGVLGLQCGKEKMQLRAGQSFTVPAGEMHRFFSVDDQKTLFNVLFQPGAPGFEKSLQVLYGLAADGRTTAKGHPRNLYHLALLVQWSDTNGDGIFRWLEPILAYLAKAAMRKGIDRELTDRYCKY